eukprot:84360_1
MYKYLHWNWPRWLFNARYVPAIMVVISIVICITSICNNYAPGICAIAFSGIVLIISCCLLAVVGMYKYLRWTWPQWLFNARYVPAILVVISVVICVASICKYSRSKHKGLKAVSKYLQKCNSKYLKKGVQFSMDMNARSISIEMLDIELQVPQNVIMQSAHQNGTMQVPMPARIHQEPCAPSAHGEMMPPPAYEPENAIMPAAMPARVYPEPCAPVDMFEVRKGV